MAILQVKHTYILTLNKAEMAFIRSALKNPLFPDETPAQVEMRETIYKTLDHERRSNNASESDQRLDSE